MIHPPQPQQEYIIDILTFDKKIERYVEDFATFSKREKLETVEEIHELLVACSRPAHPAAPQCCHQIVARVPYPEGDKNEWVCNNPLTEARKTAIRNATLAPIKAVYDRFAHLDKILSAKDPDCPMMQSYSEIWITIRKLCSTPTQEQPK